LLELIKSNLSKDLRRKYKIFKDQKKNMKIVKSRTQNENGSKGTKKNKSKSPVREFDPVSELEGYRMIANYR